MPIASLGNWGRLDGAAIRDRLRAVGGAPGTAVIAGAQGVADAPRILGNSRFQKFDLRPAARHAWLPPVPIPNRSRNPPWSCGQRHIQPYLIVRDLRDLGAALASLSSTSP